MYLAGRRGGTCAACREQGRTADFGESPRSIVEYDDGAGVPGRRGTSNPCERPLRNGESVRPAGRCDVQKGLEDLSLAEGIRGLRLPRPSPASCRLNVSKTRIIGQ